MTKAVKLLCALAISTIVPCLGHAQEWVVVDTFDGGAAQATWEGDLASMAMSFNNDQLHFTTNSENTQSIYTALPQAVSSGKVTITFDIKVDGPANAQSQAGFGVADEAKITETGWVRVGARNRFQFANPAPQTLVKAGDWGTDVLAPTEYGLWYNVWVVYDLDTDTITAYSKGSWEMVDNSAPVATWDFNIDGDGVLEDYESVKYFVLGSGGKEDAANPDVLGAIIDNIYMAVGENLTLSPTASDAPRPSWKAVDTFDDASPNAVWSGDTEALSLDFAADTLNISSASDANSSIYVELEEMTSGSHTIAFDLYLPETAERHELAFALVGENQIGLADWERLGNNDRYQTIGQNPQILVKAREWTTDLLDPTQMNTWYNIWLVYSVEAQTMTFYSKEAAAEGEPVEQSSFDLIEDYPSFKYFAIGVGRDGLGGHIDNLYVAHATELSMTPTGRTDNTPPQADNGGGNGGNGGGDFWSELGWLDGMDGSSAPNIWTNGIGWLVSDSSSSDSVMLWMPGELGFFWSQAGVYPWFWSFAKDGWFWYYEGTGDGTGAWFFDFNAGQAVWIVNG